MPGLIPPNQAVNAVGSASQPALRLISNAELDARTEAEKIQAEAPIPSLVAHLKRLWESAKTAKEPIQRQILEDYRQRNGEYEAETLAAIRETGGSEIYMLLTMNKCRTMQAWFSDVMLPEGDRPWDLETSPIAEVDPFTEMQIKQAVAQQVMEIFQAQGVMPGKEEVIGMLEGMREEVLGRIEEEAESRKQKMVNQIEEDLVEGGFPDAFKAQLYDFVTTVGGIVVGPSMQKRHTLTWRQEGEAFVPVEGEDIKKCYRRASPLDIYPSSNSSGPQDGFLFEHQRLPQSDLFAMIGAPGFDELAIKAVLDEYGRGGLREWMWHDNERSQVEQKTHYSHENNENTIDTLVFWGPIRGQLLMEFGMQGLDPYRSYEANAWMVGRYLIGVRLNRSPAGMRPYHISSLEQIPGSFWGHGLSYMLRDDQRMCNASARACANNMGIASGPQTVINDISRLPANESVSQMYPWRVWQFGPDPIGTSHRPPIEFFQPNSNANELLAVYTFFSNHADEFVPSYFSGQQGGGGAADTAAGLSMLMSNATKTAKDGVRNLDGGIVRPVVRQTYVSNMLYHDDPSIKGDLNVVARGAMSLMAREQQTIRRQEFLNNTNNPTDQAIIGLAGRAELLREVAKTLDMPADKIVPDPEALDEQHKQQQIQMGVQQALQGVAQQLGMSPQDMAAAVQGGQTRATDAAGNPVNGQDTAVF